MPIIVIKTINRCNSNCIYCFTEKGRQLQRINNETVKLLYAKICDYLDSDPEKIVEIQWHGGEPLLLGKKFYEEVANEQSRISLKFQEKIHHTMQSNLTLIDQSFLTVLLKLNLRSIGTSVDPIPGIRGIGAGIDSKLYLKKFMKGICLLEDSGIPWGINYVVTSQAIQIPEKIFYYLINLSFSKHITFSPVKTNGLKAVFCMISPGQYNKFLQTLYFIKKDRNTQIEGIEPIESMEWTAEQIVLKKPIKGEPAEFPIMMDALGYFYNHRLPDTALGNVHSDKLGNIILRNEGFHSSLKDKVIRARKCSNCELWPVCRANTVDDSFSQNEDFKNDEWCRARKEFVMDFLINQKSSAHGY